MLRGKKGKKWSVMDRILAVADVLAQDLLCPGCGQPKHEAYNPDSEGWYETKEATCQGCAAVARDHEIHKEDAPERKVWTVDTRPPDVKLRPWSPD
jgi:hypothetical protein